MSNTPSSASLYQIIFFPYSDMTNQRLVYGDNVLGNRVDGYVFGTNSSLTCEADHWPDDSLRTVWTRRVGARIGGPELSIDDSMIGVENEFACIINHEDLGADFLAKRVIFTACECTTKCNSVLSFYLVLFIKSMNIILAKF